MRLLRLCYFKRHLVHEAISSDQGCGVGENFKDSDSGMTFCSPIVTVCNTNVRKDLAIFFQTGSCFKRRSENNSEASSLLSRSEIKGTGIRYSAELIY